MKSQIVGIMPAAGMGLRLAHVDGPKELLRVLPSAHGGGSLLPVSFRLLDAFAEASIPRAIIVLRQDKGELLHTLAGEWSGPPALDFIELQDSPSPAYTVSAATRQAGDAVVALGFPDLLWSGERAFSRLLESLEEQGADIALGLFPQAPDYPTQGVELGATGRVRAFREPGEGSLPTWALVVWRPAISRFIEDLVARRHTPGARRPDADGELGLAKVVEAAAGAGFTVVGVQASDRPFLDIGRPVGLAEARRRAATLLRDNPDAEVEPSQ